MVTPDLINYIKGEQAKNISKEVIEKNLAANGWAAADTAEAWGAIAMGATKETEMVAATEEETKIYKKQARLILFIVYLCLPLFIFLQSVVDGSPVVDSGSLLLLLGYGLIVSIGVFVATAGMKAPKGKALEWGELVLSFIGSFFIATTLAFAVAFAACLFVLNGWR